jgi:hypothetical protein
VIPSKSEDDGGNKHFCLCQEHNSGPLRHKRSHYCDIRVITSNKPLHLFHTQIVFVPFVLHQASTINDLLQFRNAMNLHHKPKQLRWSRVCVLASNTQVRGSDFSRRKKFPSTPSFGGEVKPAVPCRRFAVCKISLNVTWKSAFRQNSRLLFLAH